MEVLKYKLFYFIHYILIYIAWWYKHTTLCGLYTVIGIILFTINKPKYTINEQVSFPPKTRFSNSCQLIWS